MGWVGLGGVGWGRDTANARLLASVKYTKLAFRGTRQNAGVALLTQERTTFIYTYIYISMQTKPLSYKKPLRADAANATTLSPSLSLSLSLHIYIYIYIERAGARRGGRVYISLGAV